METTVSYLTFNEVGITIAVIAVAMTFIVLTWNTVKAIHDWRMSARKPTEERLQDDESRIEDHEHRIAHLEECCTEVRGKLSADWQFQQEQAEVNRMVLMSLKSLLQHAVDGNDTAKLEQREQEIDKFLVDHMTDRRQS